MERSDDLQRIYDSGNRRGNHIPVLLFICMSKEIIVDRKPQPGDIAGYMKFAKDKWGIRMLVQWMGIITKVKKSSVQVFDPVGNSRYYVRFTDLKGLMAGVDDQGGTKAQRDMDFINDINRDMGSDDF